MSGSAGRTQLPDPLDEAAELAGLVGAGAAAWAAAAVDGVAFGAAVLVAFAAGVGARDTSVSVFAVLRVATDRTFAPAGAGGTTGDGDTWRFTAGFGAGASARRGVTKRSLPDLPSATTFWRAGCQFEWQTVSPVSNIRLAIISALPRSS